MDCESCKTCKHSKEWYKSRKLHFGGIEYCTEIDMIVFGNQLCKYYQKESNDD